jgi:leucyl aminopeptidase
VSVAVKTSAAAGAQCDAAAFVVHDGETEGRPAALKEAAALLGGRCDRLFSAAGFKGEAEKVLVHHPQGAGPRRVIFVGAGPAAKATEETWRRVAAHASRAASDVESLALFLRKGAVGAGEQAAAAVEGSLLGRYRFDRYLGKAARKPAALEDLVLVVPDAAAATAARAGARSGEATAAGVALARDLANLPGNECRPADLADAARAMARREGIRCEILDEPAMRRLGMGSLLSVNRGSGAPPRLIVLDLGKAGPRTDCVCVIGKGITFDSGGISIKPAADMDKMRYDKSGGCATIGLMLAMARLKPRVRLVGIVPACENMPSGTATRPGDVVRAMNGKTIEVLNTDAEGRLVLADAIVYARRRFEPAHIVDMATLTGSCAATFGPHASGLFGTDRALVRDLTRAGEATGERVWELPLHDEYDVMIRGTYGDLKNVGGAKAGAITAAAFLKQFAEDTSWAHLDIAGTAYDDARVYNQGSGATGIGVRLLARLLLDRYGRGGSKRGRTTRARRR